MMDEYAEFIKWMKAMSDDMEKMAKKSAAMLESVQGISKLAEEIAALAGE